MFLFTLNFKSFITIDFYLNQVELTELFCINKEKPILKCNGKCHLSSKLSETDKDETKLPYSQSSEHHLELIFDKEIANEIVNYSSSTEDNWFNFSERVLLIDFEVLSPPPQV